MSSSGYAFAEDRAVKVIELCLQRPDDASGQALHTEAYFGMN